MTTRGALTEKTSAHIKLTKIGKVFEDGYFIRLTAHVVMDSESDEGQLSDEEVGCSAVLCD